MRGATGIEKYRLIARIFQSTRPMRGATCHPSTAFRMRTHFNPRAPCGARPYNTGLRETDKEFQSTRPMRGATGAAGNPAPEKTKFQSTRPMRGATRNRKIQTNCKNISIHAPHAGRDEESLSQIAMRDTFQSTRPMRGATKTNKQDNESNDISIHAPHAGRDSKSEQIALHIFVKKAWIPDIFAQNAAFQSVLPLADRQKLLYLRCEPLRKFLRAFASHYKIIGSSGR